MNRALRGLLAMALLLQAALASALDGVVVDAASGRPLADVAVSADDVHARSDAQGRFHLDERGARALAVRAPGYRRQTVPLAGAKPPLHVALQPFLPKALYLSAWGIGDARLRGDALALAGQTELNALVIDLKGDAGVVPHASAAYAAALGAQAPVTVHDMPALLRSLRERGLYLIARIVVFKDDRLVRAHPEWAVRDAQGEVWHDREGLAWLDPFQREAWDYSLAVAEEAARFGVDEIQFDYVRFPDAAGLRFSQPNTAAARTATIEAYLDAARTRLARHGVLTAADVFGYVCWNENDTMIGQQLESIAQHVDVLSPMLYPSGFSFGIPGHRQPVAAPGEIVGHSLQRALERTGLSPLRLRPWLQAFRDYAFDRREFGAQEIRAQIDAAEAARSGGWMLWNAANHYGPAGLKAAPLP
jgi:hypothetical protein